jgi:hypothetical protein
MIATIQHNINKLDCLPKWQFEISKLIDLFENEKNRFTYNLNYIVATKTNLHNLHVHVNDKYREIINQIVEDLITLYQDRGDGKGCLDKKIKILTKCKT